MKEEFNEKFRINNIEFKNFKNSIVQYVTLREDLRGSFTLAFDIEKIQNSGL
jgi:hypothetical protein